MLTSASQPASLARHVDAGTLARGLAIWRSHQVLDADLEQPSLDEWLISGRVQGSARLPYRTDVSITLNDQGVITAFASECDCPVGHRCKHAVALVWAAWPDIASEPSTPHLPEALVAQALALMARGGPVPAAAPPPATPQERALHLAEQAWQRWLGEARPDTAAPAPTHLAHTPHPVFMLMAQRQGQAQVLTLSWGESRRAATGKGWIKVRPPSYYGVQGHTPQAAAQQDLVRLIQALPPLQPSGYFHYERPSGGVVAGSVGLLALERAAQSGLLFWCTRSDALGQPLTWGGPRELTWQWASEPHGPANAPHWTLAAQVTAATGDPLPLYPNTPPLYVDLAAGQCGPATHAGLAPVRLAHLLRMPPLPAALLAAHAADVQQQMAGLPLPPGVAPLAEVREAAMPRLRIEPAEGLARGVLSFQYGDHHCHERSQANPLPLPGLLLHRDLAAEQAARTALAALALAEVAPHVYAYPPTPAGQQAWLVLLDGDFAALRAQGFQIDLHPQLATAIAHGEEVHIALDDPAEDWEASPWFDLSLGIAVNGQRHNLLPLLPALIDHLTAHGEPLPPHVYLPQPGGGWLRLPTEPIQPWLTALIELMDGRRTGEWQGEALRLSRHEVLRTAASLGDGVAWAGADALRALMQALRGQATLPTVAPPAGLAAELRPYQLQGLSWLQFLRQHQFGGVLADDMGLGKTLQTLAHLLTEQQAGRLREPALVVAPVSLLGNWQREAARFAPGLRTHVWHGGTRHGQASQLRDADLVIAPYSLLHRDRDTWLAAPWSVVVFDEAQHLKNAHTQAAQVACELPATQRLALSGTPMENHLGELWSLFHTLMPGFLGSSRQFTQWFRTPIEKRGDGEQMARLRQRITPFMLRRTKDAVAAELPPKQEIPTPIDLGDAQASLYETIRLATERTVQAALAGKGLARSRIEVLDALLKLRQVCCDPRLVPLPAAAKVKQSAKLEWLLDALPEMLAEGRRVLLFSQFTTMLALIEGALAPTGLRWTKLTGQTQKRDAAIARFTSGEVPLFLISLKAGGVGLNLPQADTVIHYDPWWNPAAENQATDRAHRIGQTRAVMVYKLIAAGTIEERIAALQARKAALAQGLYSDAAARKQPLFTESDLAELLRPLDA
ncbi:MAG: DEAD/DEAH box helicase [Proteobacteria bacterium]|nr:DEAD/DEAH box helicase [Pseudomonadota bacterium]